jgi:hypothetical protein
VPRRDDAAYQAKQHRDQGAEGNIRKSQGRHRQRAAHRIGALNEHPRRETDRVARAHGGSVHAENRAGGGLEVVLNLSAGSAGRGDARIDQ